MKFSEINAQLIRLYEDTDVLALLARNAQSFPDAGLPGNDLLIGRIQEPDIDWLVFRFLNETDPGYAALGLPSTVEERYRDEYFAWVLTVISEEARQRGIDFERSVGLIPSPKASAN